MEIDIEGGLRVKISQKDNICSVIESPKATGTIFVPHFVEHENQSYKIITIGRNAFQNCDIDCLTFAKDSEVETFEGFCFF